MREFMLVQNATNEEEDGVTSLEVVRLRRAMSELPALEARVLKLRYGVNNAESLSHRRIANRLGLSVGAVRDLERRALAGLRRQYVIDEAA